MLIEGRITNVTTKTIGAGLHDSAVLGAVILHVENSAAFLSSAGQLVVDVDETTIYGYTVVSDEDEDYAVLSITPALAYDVEQGTPINVYPRVMQKVAEVDLLGGNDLSAGTISDVQFLHVLQAVIEEGDRVENKGEFVVMSNEFGVGDELRIINIEGSNINILGEAITGTVPGVSLTDGVPPPISPDAVVHDFSVGALIVSWDEVVNADPVTYDVYASLTSPVTTGDELVTSLSGTRTIIQRLGGVQIPMDGVTPVYVAILARDADGASPSGLGAEGSGTTRKADNELISAVYAYLGSIEANQIIAGVIDAVIGISTEGVINVGNRITIAHPDSPEGGITIWGDDAHTIILVKLHPDGSVFSGLITAQELTVVQSLRILGALSAIASGGRVKIENGIADPVAPSVSSGDLTVPYVGPPSGYVAYGIRWDNVNNKWWQLLKKSSDNRHYIRSITPEFGGVPGSLILLGDVRDTGESYFSIPGGFAVDAANQRCYVWVGMSTSSTDQWRLHRFNMTTGAVLSGFATLFDNGLNDLRPSVVCDGANVYYQGDLSDLGVLYKDNLTLSGTIAKARIPTDADITVAKLKSITSLTIAAPDVGDASSFTFHEFLTGMVYNFTMVAFSTSSIPALVRNSAKDFYIGQNFWHAYSDTGHFRSTVVNKQRTANVTTLQTSGAHGFFVGEQVTVKNVGSSMDGVFLITDVPSSTTFSYANVAADVVSVSAGGNVATYAGYYAQDQSTTLKRFSPYFPSAGEEVWAQFANMNGSDHTGMSPESSGMPVAARKWAWVTLGALPPGALDSQIWVGYGATTPGTTKRMRTEPIVGRVQILYGGKRTGTDAMYTTNTLGGSPGEVYDAVQSVGIEVISLESNVATITTFVPHGFAAGQEVYIQLEDGHPSKAILDGKYVIATIVDSTHFNIPKVHADILPGQWANGIADIPYNRWKGDGEVQLPGLRETTPIEGLFTDASSGTFVIAEQLLFRVGMVVHAYLVITRASGFSSAFVDVANVPDGFKPTIIKSSPTSTISLSTGVFYRFAVTDTGVVQVGQSAANANAMILHETWLTSDPYP